MTAFRVYGNPRTKKTSQVIGRNRRTGKPFIMSHKRTKGWEHHVAVTVQELMLKFGWRPFTGRVQVSAVFYRAKNTTGDLTGYMQALADGLERSGLLPNDRLIASWDGTRLGIDRDDPRVEVRIDPYVLDA